MARGLENVPKIAYQLLIYPATDMHMTTASHTKFAEGHLLTRASMDWFQQHYLNGPEDQDDWRASPLHAKSLQGLAAGLRRWWPAMTLCATKAKLMRWR